MGVHPDYLPGYRALSDDAARARLAAVWGVEPRRPRGLALDEILEGIEAGAIKALYVVGSNPLRGAPDADRWAKALERLDCLVVQDLFPNALTRARRRRPPGRLARREGGHDDLDRPARPARPPGRPARSARRRPDWQIIRDLGSRIADQLESLVPSTTPAPRRSSPRRRASSPTTPASATRRSTPRAPGVQWPATAEDPSGTPHLETFATPSGRARFAPAVGPTVAPAQGLALALVAETQFSAGTLADHSRRLREMRGKPSLMLSAEDAAAAGVAEGDLVSVVARAGRGRAGGQRLAPRGARASRSRISPATRPRASGRWRGTAGRPRSRRDASR